MQPPGSGRESGYSSRPADVRLLLYYTPEQTLIDYLGMHGLHFKAFFPWLLGMHIKLDLPAQFLSVVGLLIKGLERQ